MVDVGVAIFKGPSMSHSENLIQDTLSELIGKPAYSLIRTHGSMFFLEIGEPRMRAGAKREHGEWHFLIEMCAWRFDTQDAILVASNDDQSFIDEKFNHLKLGLVETATVRAPSHDLDITFSSGVRLLTFLMTGEEPQDSYIQWNLFCPDDKAWVTEGTGVLTRRSIYE